MNRRWKRSIANDRAHFDFIMDMYSIPHVVPINPRRFAMELDHLPATNYIWVILAFNSSEESQRKASMALAKAGANYFYERCVFGLLDMGYPSNVATFGHLVGEMPSLIIKFPQTDHLAVPRQDVQTAHVKLGPIKTWGAVIGHEALRKNVAYEFQMIIENYWKQLESYFKLHIIYSHFYHDPRKESVQEAIEHFDEELHDEVYDRAVTEFSLQPNTKKFSDFMMYFQYHEKAVANLKKHLRKLIDNHVSAAFQKHRKDKMHLQLEPQKLPDLKPFLVKWERSFEPIPSLHAFRDEL